jgi:hypothetical protein
VYVGKKTVGPDGSEIYKTKFGSRYTQDEVDDVGNNAFGRDQSSIDIINKHLGSELIGLGLDHDGIVKYFFVVDNTSIIKMRPQQMKNEAINIQRNKGMI